MKLLIVIVIVYLVQICLAIHRSPLFGGRSAGDRFDDNAYSIVPNVTGFSLLLIHSGDIINGIQAVYQLENGKNKTSTYHGGPGGETNNIELAPGMSIVRVEGELISGPVSSQQYLTSLSVYARYPEDLKLQRYGPFGKPSTGEFTFSFAGIVVGLFGRSEKRLDAIGFDIDTFPSAVLPYYKKTSLVGTRDGDAFDDDIVSFSPVRIKSLIIRYGGVVIGIKTIYVLRNKSLLVKCHGEFHNKTTSTAIKPNNATVEKDDVCSETVPDDAQIDFADDERIMQVDIHTTVGSEIIEFIMISTSDSQGSVKTYGPYGRSEGPYGHAATFRGVINGFFGYERDEWICSLGFYI